MLGGLLIEALFGGWFMAGGTPKHELGEVVASTRDILEDKSWDLEVNLMRIPLRK